MQTRTVLVLLATLLISATSLSTRRRGRNSKLMLFQTTAAPESTTAPATELLPTRLVEEEEDVEKDVTELLADLKQAIAQADPSYEAELEVENDLAGEGEQKDRLAKDAQTQFDFEHSWRVEGEEAGPGRGYQAGVQTRFGQQNAPQTAYPNQRQYIRQQQQYNQEVGAGRDQPRQFQPGAATSGDQPGRAAPFNRFGDAMGEDASTDPERNQFSSRPQLLPRQQAGEEGGELGSAAEPAEKGDEEVRCINKVMQVEETVYENRIKCQHTFTEKCHDTFITDYIPTQERKCETSFSKNCHITYKPMMFEEEVEVCNEPLTKVCNNETIGKGEDICKTHYETNCETRFKEHEVEQDEPVCKMVIERKCQDVTVPGESRRRRRQVTDGEPGAALAANPELGPPLDTNQLGALGPDSDLLSIGEECEDWPVQKCTLERKTVKKVNPETSCQKMPREICAPSNCVVQPSPKSCRKENRELLQNIPSEECDLEPQENCKMETVLVPRLVQQPNCIKVPKEICVNEKANPKKVKKPVIKEWCYKPSDLKSPSTRLALAQFFSN